MCMIKLDYRVMVKTNDIKVQNDAMDFVIK